MLAEIRVRDIGVIEHLDLALRPGMTALTGETGAGKTLVVEALELLLGGRADSTLVRAGAEQAVVEGRFEPEEGGEQELVIRREIPASGRSRAEVNGKMATVGSLQEIGADLVDLHGQHAHQSLLHQRAQREALDAFGGIDTRPADEARQRLAEIDRRIDELGGDPRQLARETDLLRFQIGELEAARLSDPHEETSLRDQEEILAAADSLRVAAETARALLAGGDSGPTAGAEPGAEDVLGLATAELAHLAPLDDLALRLRSVMDEIQDVAGELRVRAEGFEADPEKLASVQARRRLLAELRRKYGDSLAEVIEYEKATRARLADLEAGEDRRAELRAERDTALAELRTKETHLGEQRRHAAPDLAAAIAAHFDELALARGRLEIRAGPGRGDEVTWLFGANPGEPAQALDKVASGGELARVMLATRLVLSQAPPTLVFDEVDAGIGGEAALAVGRALHDLAAGGHQVLVVTHLAQVAAFADAQVAVSKQERDGRTIASVRTLDPEERLVELSRMLSGQPESSAARRHAEELLGLAAGGSRSARCLPRSSTL